MVRVKTWCCLESLHEFFIQRLRWAIIGSTIPPFRLRGTLFFTQGLPWTVVGVILAPTAPRSRELCGSLT